MCENLVFEQQYGTLASFTSFRIDFPSSVHVFPRRLPEPPFMLIYADCIRKWSISGPPSKYSGRRNPPTLACVRRCQTRECGVCQNLPVSGPRFGFQKAAKIILAGHQAAQKFICLWFGPPFCRTQKHRKNYLAEIYKDLKKSARNHPRHRFG